MEVPPGRFDLTDEQIAELPVLDLDEALKEADPHGLSVDLERAIAERRAYGEQLRRLTNFIAAKQIKKRRRKLGRNGFSTRKMGFPKGKRGMQA